MLNKTFLAVSLLLIISFQSLSMEKCSTLRSWINDHETVFHEIKHLNFEEIQKIKLNKAVLTHEEDLKVIMVNRTRAFLEVKLIQAQSLQRNSICNLVRGLIFIDVANIDDFLGSTRYTDMLMDLKT